MNLLAQFDPGDAVIRVVLITLVQRRSSSCRLRSWATLRFVAVPTHGTASGWACWSGSRSVLACPFSPTVRPRGLHRAFPVPDYWRADRRCRNSSIPPLPGRSHWGVRAHQPDGRKGPTIAEMQPSRS